MGVANLPPLALYVHVPWCVRKCPYCDFNSHPLHGELPERDYLAALIRDLELALPQVWGRKVSTVFIGGGTPSLLSAGAVEELLSAVRSLTPLAADAEITLEANPGAIEAGKFAGYARAGVNRLSVGIQSFNPKHLQALGRIHDDAEAYRAVEIALANFRNINLDLMYALPGQSLEEARRDIETAISCGAQHVSAYHLTLEPNTPFHHHPPQLPEDDLAADMQLLVEQALIGAGYRHYETSAFSRQGRECRHNLNYWRFGDYLGIGAGAHSKISFADRILRQVRAKQPRQYLTSVAAGRPVEEERAIAAGELAFEFMMNALRLIEGFPVSLFAGRTGLSITGVRHALERAEGRGLITRDPQRIMPTPLGSRFLNDLLQYFLPGNGPAG